MMHRESEELMSFEELRELRSDAVCASPDQDKA
jgi:hypothetical protein